MKQFVLAEEAKKEGKALSIGLLGNAADVLPEMIARGFHSRCSDRPNICT